MAALDAHRDRALAALGDAYARDLLSAESLELRIEEALHAPSPPALRQTLFGLPIARRAATLHAVWHGARWTGLQLEGGLLLATEAARGSWVVGRSRSCDVRLVDDAVSRRHARVTVRGGCWTIEDLGSSNGTWVNGRPLDRGELRPGDVVELGTAVARLVATRR